MPSNYMLKHPKLLIRQRDGDEDEGRDREVEKTEQNNVKFTIILFQFGSVMEIIRQTPRAKQRRNERARDEERCKGGWSILDSVVFFSVQYGLYYHLDYGQHQ